MRREGKRREPGAWERLRPGRLRGLGRTTATWATGPRQRRLQGWETLSTPPAPAGKWVRWGFVAAAAGCGRAARGGSLAPARSGREPARRRNLGAAGVQARERETPCAGSRGRCSARAAREAPLRAQPWRGERSPRSAPSDSEPRAREGSPWSLAYRVGPAPSRSAGARQMLLEPGSLGGGSALGAEFRGRGRQVLAEGRWGRQALAVGRYFISDHPKHCFLRRLTVNLCTEVILESTVSREKGGCS